MSGDIGSPVVLDTQKRRLCRMNGRRVPGEGQAATFYLCSAFGTGYKGQVCCFNLPTINLP